MQRLLEEVLSGLEVMHDAGYVHRDIKPGNLMLREEDGSAVVLDFGAARQAVGQRSKAITSILTPGYAPVEQYDGKVDRVGAWTDIYALGMVAYRCISGISDNDLPDAVARMLAHTKGGTTLPPAVEAGKGKYNAKLLEAIDWAIEADEEDRPQSMDAWRQALAGGSRRQTPAKSRRKPVTRKTRDTATARSGTSWSAVALAMVIVALLGAGAWWAWLAYPAWFGRVTEDAPALAQQDTPVAAPGEARQAVERAETGEAHWPARNNPRLWKLRHSHPRLRHRQGEKRLWWNRRQRRRSGKRLLRKTKSRVAGRRRSRFEGKTPDEAGGEQCLGQVPSGIGAGAGEPGCDKGHGPGD